MNDRVALSLTPRGHLRLQADPEAAPLPADLRQRVADAFTRGAGHGLLELGAREVGTVLPATFGWWRDLGTRFVTALCATPDATADSEIKVAAPDEEVLARLVLDAPPMAGAEYLSTEVLAALWGAMERAVSDALAELGAGVGVGSKTTTRPDGAAGRLPELLASWHPGWNLVGRVHFNLAERRQDPEAPFAFLATYTTGLSAQGRAQHQPLSAALQAFAGARKNAQLLSLLLPVQRAAQQCAWLRDMIDTGEVYHPLRWQAADALRLLHDVPKLEASGVVVRMPATWPGGRPARPQVSAVVGTTAPSAVGLDALLDFRMDVTLEGQALGPAELKALLKAADGLHLVRGHWVEVNGNRLGRMVERFRAIETLAGQKGVSFAEAMRLVAGTQVDSEPDAEGPAWSAVTAGDWLARTLKELRDPQRKAESDPGGALKAKLRPYQQAGVQWLHLLVRLGLGACLADDMGLGKTIQTLALLLVLQGQRGGGQGQARQRRAASSPSLIVAPASLLANWAAEAERFAPSLRVVIAHPSAMAADTLRALDDAALTSVDVVITSYAMLLRLPALTEQPWRVVIADEAQALKNPGAKQTRQLKRLKADARIALTGTPVENRLSDLWSLFDFTHPGLLGSQKDFATFSKRLAAADHFGPLRRLVQPYILRRLKTDRRVIADLPDKTELDAWCALAPAQAALYQDAVEELAQRLDGAEGIGRKGLVLSFLMRFKQICNHPSQWLGDAVWGPQESGKFARLRELAEVVRDKQEKMLVFTQFRETTEPLAAFLGSIFGREGLILHGGTPVAERRRRVERFQNDELIPFFVLSIKAGGSGLNLTAASHVIHFDRWWNPAVENQATDRAFRIGQRRNVLVHKFICRGTVEERIDTLIRSKNKLVEDVLEGGTERLLTEMDDRQLLDLVRLDIHTARQE